MKLNDTYYRSAALEHLNLSQRAYEQGEYFVAHYFSGIAVECMLRAHMYRVDRKWRPEHDIYNLAKDSRFFDLIPAQEQEQWVAKLSALNLTWRSNHRFFSEGALRKYLNGIGATRNMRGNVIKENARVVRNLAQEVVGLGETRWR